ncbi:MAG: bifunctional heptose 7-phosphate kinase/heptose 1-phosphate adenyltransferase [Desulfovibrionaceae bacterium]
MRLNEILRGMAKTPVMIIGDIMLDHYVFGSVERISPEAPVPVVTVEQERYVLGGAGNVARNIAALQGEPLLVAVRGEDAEGEVLERLCRESGIGVSLLADDSRRTTLKTRIVAHQQQVVRVDHESTSELSDELLDGLFGRVAERLDGVRAVVVSDYGKGLVSRRFMDRLLALARSRPEPPMILVDPKTRNAGCYTGVDMLTPNTKEAAELAGFHATGFDGIIRMGRAIFERLGCRHLLITLGAGGMALFESPSRAYHIPTFAQTVFDVTGAGDTVIATVAQAVSAGAGLLDACTLANYAAGIVVGQVGAATASPQDMTRVMGELPGPDIRPLNVAGE